MQWRGDQGVRMLRRRPALFGPGTGKGRGLHHTLEVGSYVQRIRNDVWSSLAEVFRAGGGRFHWRLVPSVLSWIMGPLWRSCCACRQCQAIPAGGQVLKAFGAQVPHRRRLQRKRWSGRHLRSASQCANENAGRAATKNREAGVHGTGCRHRHRCFREGFSAAWSSLGRRTGPAQNTSARPAAAPLSNAPSCLEVTEVCGGARRQGLGTLT